MAYVLEKELEALCKTETQATGQGTEIRGTPSKDRADPVPPGNNLQIGVRIQNCVRVRLSNFVV